MATWCLVKCEAVVINDDPTKIPHHKRRGAIYGDRMVMWRDAQSKQKKGCPLAALAFA